MLEQFREEVRVWLAKAFGLAQRMTMEENRSGGTPTFAASMFKYYSIKIREEASGVSV